MMKCAVTVFALLTVILALPAAWPAGPIRVTDPTDRIIEEAFLRQVDALPDRMTVEYLRQEAETNGEGPETIAWVVIPSIRMTLTAYQLTGDEKYLAMFVQVFDRARAAMTVGPDGFLGWYGKSVEGFWDPRDPDRKTDATISSFGAVELIGEFACLVDEDPALKRKYARQRAEYLDLAEHHLVKKYDVRGGYVDLGRGGAVYRAPGFGQDALHAHLTLPHNMDAFITAGLLALYRATGNDDYLRKAVKLGTRFKRCLALKDGHYEWNYWDPAGAWDVRTDGSGQWKHWIGREHRGGYYSLSLSTAIALYDYGLVFDKTDVNRFLKTQLSMCWNGDPEHPVWARVDGTRPEGYTQGEYISGALAPFSEKVAAYLYGRAAQQERTKKENLEHDWQGGVIAGGWLQAKLIDYPAAKGGKQVYLAYGKRFLAKKANRDFLAALAFQVEPPGYAAPESPADMHDMPAEPGPPQAPK